MTNRRNRITKGTIARDNVETAICYTERGTHQKAKEETIIG